jgi:hypothetical protein
MGCAGRLGELDGCYSGANSETAGRAVGRTEPDVHLIKQVEQVTTSALGGPAWRFARVPSMGVTDAVEILLFLIWQLLHWLLFGCKNSQNIQKRPRATCGNAAGPNRRFHAPGHMGCDLAPQVYNDNVGNDANSIIGRRILSALGRSQAVSSPEHLRTGSTGP